MSAHFGDVERLQEQVDRLKATLTLEIKKTTALEIVMTTVCSAVGESFPDLLQDALLKVEVEYENVIQELASLEDSSNTTSDAEGN